MSSESSMPQIQNIVSTINLDCKLDLKIIAMRAPNTEYNPKRFVAVIMRIRKPRTTALLFNSGKMVCTGAKDEDKSRIAARKFARIIQKLGFSVKFTNFKIQNMVGSSNVHFKIALKNLYNENILSAHYEPELFPGLLYHIKKPKIIVLVFSSGKIVITGAKQREAVYSGFDYIFAKLLNCIIYK